MKESEDLESMRDFRSVFGRVLDVKESVSDSGLERADALRVMVFARGSLTQSSGHAESRGLLSLFSGPSWWMRTSPDQSLMLELWRKLSWIFDSPWRRVQRCHKRGKVCYQDGTVSPGELAFCLSQVSRKGREWWASCSEVEPLLWVKPELLFFCLECEEPLPDLLSDLEESDFCLVLFPEDLEV